MSLAGNDIHDKGVPRLANYMEDPSKLLSFREASSLSSLSSLSSDSDKSSGCLSFFHRWCSFRKKSHGLVEVNEKHSKFLLAVCIRHSFRYHLPSYLSREAGKKLHARHYLEKSDYDEVFESDFNLADDTRRHLEASKRPTSVALRRQSSRIIREKIRPHSRCSSTSSASQVKTSLSKWANVEVEFVALAPLVFSVLRIALGISHEEFLESISPSEFFMPYLQYKTNSKANSNFFVTHDRRFLLKFERAEHISTFRSFLEDYIEHFITSPHSLIVKILGAFAIKINNGQSVHFTVLQSVFWPTRFIHEKYDLKGCLKGRKEAGTSRCMGNTRKRSIDSMEETWVVFKDANFVGTRLDLGPQLESWFLRQMSRDLAFLKKLGLVDYSLLLGIQKVLSPPPSSISGREFYSLNQTLSRRTPPYLNTSREFQKTLLEASSGIDTELPVDAQITHSVAVSDSHRRSHQISVSRSPIMSLQRRVQFKDTGSLDYPVMASPATSLHFQLHTPPPVSSSSSGHSSPISLPPLHLGESADLGFKISDHAPYHSGRRRQKRALKKVVSRILGSANANNKVIPMRGLGAFTGGSEEKLDGLHTSPLSRERRAEKRSWSIPGEKKLPYEDINHLSKASPSLWSSTHLPPLLHRSPSERSKQLVHNIPKSAKVQQQPSIDFDRIDTTGSNSELKSSEQVAWIHQKDISRDKARDAFSENRRQLLDIPNAVHILDSPKYRYYVGIIDIFSTYDRKRRISRAFKSLFYCGTDNHSSVPSELYADRLYTFIEDHISK